jgi:hypothetical protein
LEQGEGLKCKIEWIQTGLQIEFTNQGLRCKVCKAIGLRDNLEMLGSSLQKGSRFSLPVNYFSEEKSWTKSTGLWTEGDGAGPWSMVDRGSYPFRGSNLGHPSGFRRPRADGDELEVIVGGAARARDGQVARRGAGRAIRRSEAHRKGSRRVR